MSADWSNLSDEALARRLATELPRYTAPVSLKVAVVEALEPRPTRTRWLAPALSALATAMLFALLVIPTLSRSGSGDPFQRLVNAVVAEHARAIMWGARVNDVIPAALPRLTQESGIWLGQAFIGDDRLAFLGAEPVYLDWRRGVALHYRDAEDHHLTYIALPAPHLPLPERRIQVDQFKPALVRTSGYATWVWKHGDLVCFLVSDMTSDSELSSFEDYFVRVRAATEPVLAD